MYRFFNKNLNQDLKIQGNGIALNGDISTGLGIRIKNMEEIKEILMDLVIAINTGSCDDNWAKEMLERIKELSVHLEITN